MLVGWPAPGPVSARSQGQRRRRLRGSPGFTCTPTAAPPQHAEVQPLSSGGRGGVRTESAGGSRGGQDERGCTRSVDDRVRASALAPPPFAGGQDERGFILRRDNPTPLVLTPSGGGQDERGCTRSVDDRVRASALAPPPFAGGQDERGFILRRDNPTPLVLTPKSRGLHVHPGRSAATARRGPTSLVLTPNDDPERPERARASRAPRPQRRHSTPRSNLSRPDPERIERMPLTKPLSTPVDSSNRARR